MDTPAIFSRSHPHPSPKPRISRYEAIFRCLLRNYPGFIFLCPLSTRIPFNVSTSLFATFLFLVVCLSAFASPVDEVLELARERSLSNHPQWLSLLHQKSGASSDRIISADFYLSPHGSTDPESELEATVRALESSWDGDPNRHPRCRFPARYLWLARHISLPHYTPRDKRCTNLETWALIDDLDSVSLYLIGGYFGNPASTFGHAVLKFNSGSKTDTNPLFDVTVGFGALVPENEWSVRYILKGLFGGYSARFLDKYYYAQDLVYSRSEFRDIWDFQLALAPDDRELLVFHVWELLGHNFNYFFLDRNCAYRLAELIELVVDTPVAEAHLGWYAPVDLFFGLRDADKARATRGESSLITSVTFIPSTQRTLIHQLRNLTPSQRKLFEAILTAGPDSIEQQLRTIDVRERITILDALLAHADYRMTVLGDEHEPFHKLFRDRVLLARLLLPSSSAKPEPVPELPSPTEGSRPSRAYVGVGWDNRSAFTRLNWSPFAWEIVGQNSLEGDELVVSDLTLGVLHEEESLFVDRFDLLRIINFNTTPETSADASGVSWELRLGSERVRYEEGDRYDGILSLGFGRAAQPTESMIVYGMVDGAIHTLESYGRIRPHLGLRLAAGPSRLWLYGGVESQGQLERYRDVWGGKGQYQISAGSALQFEISNERATRYSIGMSWFF